MNGAPRFPDKQGDLALAFYLGLKEQNAATLKLRTDFIKMSLVGTFSYYAAIFSTALGIVDTRFLTMMAWLPVAFNFVGLVLELGSARINRDRGKMMSAIERDMAVTYWDDFYPKDSPETQPRPLTYAAIAYWVLIVCINIGVGILVSGVGIS